jgi:AraC-like DNA-binding protein
MMNCTTIPPDQLIALFVKNILVFEEEDKLQQTVLPFFADGYPGLMFQDTDNGLLVHPHNKSMPVFFLYGQTIRPIELVLNGRYRLIVFQLYPFVFKRFFNVNPKDLNDNCYNLETAGNAAVTGIIDQLKHIAGIQERVAIISSFLLSNFQTKKESLDFTVRQAIQIILDNRGKVSISSLPAMLHVTARTLERRFSDEVGVTLKQFSTIIQFQLSLEQLSVKDYSKLSDIVYENGFADQSHFIKVFKAFTGRTPKVFQQKKV